MEADQFAPTGKVQHIGDRCCPTELRIARIIPHLLGVDEIDILKSELRRLRPCGDDLILYRLCLSRGHAGDKTFFLTVREHEIHHIIAVRSGSRRTGGRNILRLHCQDDLILIDDIKAFDRINDRILFGRSQIDRSLCCELASVLKCYNGRDAVRRRLHTQSRGRNVALRRRRDGSHTVQHHHR